MVNQLEGAVPVISNGVNRCNRLEGVVPVISNGVNN